MSTFSGEATTFSKEEGHRHIDASAHHGLVPANVAQVWSPEITEEEAAALAGYTKSALASSILPYQIMIDPIKSKVKTTDTRAQNAKYRTISGK